MFELRYLAVYHASYCTRKLLFQLKEVCSITQMPKHRPKLGSLSCVVRSDGHVCGMLYHKAQLPRRLSKKELGLSKSQLVVTYFTHKANVSPVQDFLLATFTANSSQYYRSIED